MLHYQSKKIPVNVKNRFRFEEKADVDIFFLVSVIMNVLEVAGLRHTMDIVKRL